VILVFLRVAFHMGDFGSHYLVFLIAGWKGQIAAGDEELGTPVTRIRHGMDKISYDRKYTVSGGRHYTLMR
jgi:hypothetical protein